MRSLSQPTRYTELPLATRALTLKVAPVWRRSAPPAHGAVREASDAPANACVRPARR